MPTCSNISCSFKIEAPPQIEYTHMIYEENNKVYASNIDGGGIINGSFNQVLASTVKSNNKVIIKDGIYDLNPINLPPNVRIDGQSKNVIIKSTITDPQYLIDLKSNSYMSNMTFDNASKSFTFNLIGDNIINWQIDNCHFIKCEALKVVNLNKGFPTNGYGKFVNNTGLYSKLGYIQGVRDITIQNNDFRNYNGSEFFDFNYNVHNCLFDNNKFINAPGFSISQEMIDMIGGNSLYTNNNTITNNTLISNFQSGIRPAKTATNNIIENNYIEWLPGPVSHAGSIYMYGSGSTDFAWPKGNKIRNNTIKGGRVGIEMSGAKDNTITGNKISGCKIGINVVNKTIYGDTLPCIGNVITDNIIDNIDYGIYIKASPNNTIKNNPITNYRIKDIYNA